MPVCEDDVCVVQVGCSRDDLHADATDSLVSLCELHLLHDVFLNDSLRFLATATFPAYRYGLLEPLLLLEVERYAALDCGHVVLVHTVDDGLLVSVQDVPLLRRESVHLPQDLQDGDLLLQRQERYLLVYSEVAERLLIGLYGEGQLPDRLLQGEEINLLQRLNSTIMFWLLFLGNHLSLPCL